MKKMKIIVAVSALLTCGYGFGMEKTYTSIDLDGKNKELTLMIARMKKGQEIDKSKAKELIQTLNANGRIVSTQVTAYVQKYNESPLEKLITTGASTIEAQLLAAINLKSSTAAEVLQKGVKYVDTWLKAKHTPSEKSQMQQALTGVANALNTNNKNDDTAVKGSYAAMAEFVKQG